jgi:hypothetical protein
MTLASRLAVFSMIAVASGLCAVSVYADGQPQDGQITAEDARDMVGSARTGHCYNPKTPKSEDKDPECDPCENKTDDGDQRAKTQGGNPDPSDQCPQTHPSGNSLIDTTTLNHHQIAKEFRVGRGSADCASCGSGSSSLGGLFNLRLNRRHRYRDMTTYSSFGPGVYNSYDTKLHLYDYDDGIMADLFEPGDTAPRRFVDGLEGDTRDGVLINVQNKGFRDIRLYSQTTEVSQLASADKAVLTSYDGRKHTFELFALESFTGIAGGQENTHLLDPADLPSSGLVAHWQFNEGNGQTAGDSVGSYDGGISGPSWVGTSGAPSGGSALSFDGTGGGVNAGNVPVGSAGGARGAFTAAFWVKSGTQTQNYPALLAKCSGAAGERSFLIDRFKISGGLRFYIYLDGTNAQLLATPQQVLVADKWQHVAVTYDGYQQRIFIDGQKVAQSPSLNASFSTARNSDLVVGGRGSTNLFVGEMDDVRLYSRALTSAEIQAVMQRELLASYSFEEATGDTTEDGTGNGNTGELLGGATRTISGPCDRAIEFDGIDDAVRVNSSPTILSGNCVSVSAWVRPDMVDAPAIGDGSRSIVSRGNGIFLRLKDGQYQFGTSTVGFISPVKLDIPAADIGAWVHLAGTYDGQWWRLYRNGVLVARQLEARGGSAIDENWVIGNNGDMTQPFQGAIDSVHIYNHAVSADEVASLAQLPIKGGRLVKIEDRNGYGIDLTYRDADFTAQQLTDAPDRRWQIRAVTDAYGRSATFHYKSVQESGRWVVEKIDLPDQPNNPTPRHIQYNYADGKLASVDHPDGTQSTFTYAVDSTSQTTTVDYRDASAVGTHRNKRVYLTNVATTRGLESAKLYSQASLLVRLVTNGAEEVSFLAKPDQADYTTVMYCGMGGLYEKYNHHHTRFYRKGWTYGADPLAPYPRFDGTLEDTYPTTQYHGTVPPPAFTPGTPIARAAPSPTNRMTTPSSPASVMRITPTNAGTTTSSSKSPATKTVWVA